MMNNKLRELIIPQAKMNMEQKDWYKLENMLNEARIYKEQGKTLIALPPEHTPTEKQIALSMVFNAINGAYLYVDDWENIKTKGEPL